VLGPFRHAAHHAAGALGGDDRLSQFERIPGRDRAPHRLTVFGHAENLERRRSMVREIGVNIAPVAVLRRIDAGDRARSAGTRLFL
jgi:hypothetical protein